MSILLETASECLLNDSNNRAAFISEPVNALENPLKLSLCSPVEPDIGRLSMLPLILLFRRHVEFLQAHDLVRVNLFRRIPDFSSSAMKGNQFRNRKPWNGFTHESLHRRITRRGSEGSPTTFTTEISLQLVDGMSTTALDLPQ